MFYVLSFALWAIVYLFTGYILASYLWWIYREDVSRENFSWGNLIWWPLHTFEGLGLFELDSGTSSLIESFDELPYKAWITLVWPMRILSSVITWCVFIISITIKFLFKAVYTATIVFIRMMNAIFRKKSPLNKVIHEELVLIWTEDWAISF